MPPTESAVRFVYLINNIIKVTSCFLRRRDATESAKKETRESWNKEGQRYEEEPDSIENYINIQINIFGNLCTSVAWNSPFYICVMMPIDRVQ